MSEFQELFLGLSISTWLSISLFIAVVYIVAQWKIYEKAGQKGWAALIPFYNIYILLKLGFGDAKYIGPAGK